MATSEGRGQGERTAAPGTRQPPRSSLILNGSLRRPLATCSGRDGVGAQRQSATSRVQTPGSQRRATRSHTRQCHESKLRQREDRTGGTRRWQTS
eukprot:12013648-Alexandrium_andersonii.AAC.1